MRGINSKVVQRNYKRTRKTPPSSKTVYILSPYYYPTEVPKTRIEATISKFFTKILQNLYRLPCLNIKTL